jgi:transcription termination factor Rho
MYDITQLNDLLVPELLDIAEQYDISNAKKLVKQDLINKILENQSIMSTDKNKDGEKPKRKRIVKSAAAEPEETPTAAKPKKPEYNTSVFLFV